MKNIKLVLIIALTLCAQLTQAATPKEVIAKIQSQFTKAKTLGAFLDAQKDIMNPTDFRMLGEKFDAWKIKSRSPKITASGSDTLRVEYQNNVMSLRIISLEQATFEVNNKPLDFRGDSADIILEKIEAVLPKTSSSLFSLLLPSATAADDSDQTHNVFKGALALAVAVAMSGDCDQLDEILRKCGDAKDKLANVTQIKEMDCPDRGNHMVDLLYSHEDIKRTCKTKSAKAKITTWAKCINELREGLINVCPSLKAYQGINGSWDESGKFKSSSRR